MSAPRCRRCGVWCPRRTRRSCRSPTRCRASRPSAAWCSPVRAMAVKVVVVELALVCLPCSTCTTYMYHSPMAHAAADLTSRDCACPLPPQVAALCPSRRRSGSPRWPCRPRPSTLAAASPSRSVCSHVPPPHRPARGAPGGSRGRRGAAGCTKGQQGASGAAGDDGARRRCNQADCACCSLPSPTSLLRPTVMYDARHRLYCIASAPFFCSTPTCMRSRAP